MGRTVTLVGEVRDTAGHRATATCTLTVPLLVGMEALNGDPTRRIVADYPGIRYMRDFGVKLGGENLPSLTPHGTGKLADMPATCIPHVSWKTDVERLKAWLDGLTRPTYLTWYHEPMGDVVPAIYRATATRVTQILAAHPRRRLVLGHGPIVTRYWLDEGGGNPADWAYPGMTHYGVDAYQNTPTATSYWAPPKMFGVAFAKVRAALPGVRLWVPEYGITRLNGDTTGGGRAAAIRDHVGWLRQQPDVDAVGSYNNAVDFPQYALTDAPSQQAWRDMQTS